LTKRNVILHFDASLVDKPLICELIRSHDLMVTILQARITPEEDGNMLMQVEGSAREIKRALRYLDARGVRMLLPTKNMIWNEEHCTHCGACVGQCLAKALAIDADTGRLRLDDRSCLGCRLCIPACPFGALTSVEEHVNNGW
jgi:L-aspartate semialdehyde sulfurtransferase ferredoxin